ncbi:MAG: tyrosine--tRNA ligase [Kordiimonadaceae bacterium]|nr:tyrosine--tRNA ligase [Kordiimonadaceae bacterium]MBO6570150.1 tyrosine--tRNA ligase [Kordiimonadaceae bacterium]MBO6965752.1 tyrosine--tRNA ligase [Kordiimonadaceae bacterium]
MTSLKSDFLQILTEREFIHQVTDLEGLDAKMAAKEKEGPISAYIGFDCTGTSLHVGSLVQIMMLRWLQKCGHKPIVLLGGGTTRIGDPSGKDESRKLLTDADIANNMNGIRTIFDQFLTFGDGTADASMVNNAEWLDELEYINFLRDVGTHFTINRMLTFDSVKLRLDREQPLTFLEFNYMILQAYDFMELGKRYDCSLQMGGSDQWGNIVNGMELGRRAAGLSLFGLTTPLITTADGKKMGKTAEGAVWLNEEALPAYDYWQFWRNTQDADVGKFLRLFTELPLDEVRRLEALEGSEINEAKIVLANEATKMCRGEDAARKAHGTAKETFEKGGAGADLPTVNLDREQFETGTNIVDLFVEAGLGASKGEVKRLIKQGGAKLNDTRVENADVSVDLGSFEENQIKLSAGKKRHALVKIT